MAKIHKLTMYIVDPEEYINNEEDIEDMYEEFEDSMPCDLYGGCAGSACRNWINCHN